MSGLSCRAGESDSAAASETNGPRRIVRLGGILRGTWEEEEAVLAIFMVERNYADELEASADTADGINRINAEEGVRWLYSFLAADKRKTYCLYEAPSPEAIRLAAARAGLPADVIIEVTDRINPDGALADI